MSANDDNPPSTPGNESTSYGQQHVSSSLHNGSATTTFGALRGGGLGSDAFQSPGVTNINMGNDNSNSNSGYINYGMSTPLGALSGTTPGGGFSTPGAGGLSMTPGGGAARGDRRSKMVRERSRSSAAFASSSSISRPSPGLVVSSSQQPPLASTSSSSSSNNPVFAKQDARMKHIAEEEIRGTEFSSPVEKEVAPALFTSFCYKGMEVIFTATNNYSDCYLLGIHARTRVPFQKCLIANNKSTTTTTTTTTTTAAAPISKTKLEIVQLTSHSTTGYIFAADNYGTIRSFYPVRSDPMVEAYGKFRWVAGSVAPCREVFGYPLLQTTTATPCGMDGMDSTDGAPVGSGSGGTMEGAPTLSLESCEDGVEVSNTFSIDKMMPSTCNSDMLDNTNAKVLQRQEQATTLESCFCRTRRKKCITTRYYPSTTTQQHDNSNNSPGNAKGLQGSYPLTDGQPPLPTNNNNNTDAASSRAMEDEYGVTICASMTEKRVLIVHKDQLAIFDFSLPAASSSTPPGVPPPNTALNVSHNTTLIKAPPEALLLWTHKLQGSIIDHASISGDGCAIALALRGEGVGVPYPFGVRTFVRDEDDGSGLLASSAPGAAAGSNNGKGSEHKKAGGNTNAGGKPPIHRRTGSGLKPLPVHHSPPLPQRKKVDGLLLENVLDGTANNATSSSQSDGTTIIPPSSKQQVRGILYKPGQFLVHSAPVTRLAFRGYGTLTSSSHHNNHNNHSNNSSSRTTNQEDDDEGNDLLMTTCSIDCSVRIFSQNSWRQLMHWNSPPKSRADWVRGIGAANLGDLDSSPTTSNGNSSSKKKKGDDDGRLTPIPKQDGVDHSSHHQQSPSRNSHSHPTDNSSVSSDTSGGINRALLASPHNHRGAPPTPNASFPSHSVPGTHAGAWIAELTFRNAFPALRLSRLSYMKTGGDDALPAHFESVAAILPPGSISEEVVLEEGMEGMGECRMEVEGIWPTWDPWEPDLRGSSRSGGAGSGEGSERTSGGKTAGASNNPLGGSMPLGSPTAAGGAPRLWLGDGSDLGGSMMPPSELRITSSHHTCSDSLTQIEMPLWGDKDFGAMEFGAPLRYVMMMPTAEDTNIRRNKKVPEAFLEYESGSRLCAQASFDRRSIDLYWRRHGAVNLEEITLESEISASKNNDGSGAIRRFQDLSLTPLPLALPSLTLPGGHNHGSTGDSQPLPSTSFEKHAVSSLHWWPDENYGGPPRLVSVTHGGTIIVYEMPPPWSALEPPMPAYDPFDDDEDSRGSSVESDFDLSDIEGGVFIDEGGLEESCSENSRSRVAEYEVSIGPHPDFGLGLRLEAQAEGMPPIAGSFKKHPLSGGRLPAERCGVIALGDELLAVNDVSLEGRKFEDAIATVRQIGYDSFGSPLRMRFRRCRGKRKSTLGSSGGSGSRRRSYTLESKEADAKNIIIADGWKGSGNGDGGGSYATVEVGAEDELQQEFGRIIAIVRDAIVDDNGSSSLHPDHGQAPPAMLLLPWNFGKGAIVSPKMYGGALILWAVPGQRIIKAARLEAVLDIDPENARFEEMGSISLDEDATVGAKTSTVKSISYISSTEKGWLVAIHDCDGNVSLLFLETTSTVSNDSEVTLRASFRHYPSIFNSYGESAANNNNDPQDSFILQSFSLELFGGMKQCEGGCKELTIWSALPQSMHGNAEEGSSQQFSEYNSVTISFDDIHQLSSDEVMLDFQWVTSGFVDAFPWLVIFTQSAAIVYHRSGIQLQWQPLAIFSYSEKLCTGTINPHNAFPHLITALRCVVLSNDEQGSRMKSDWHPESILASICTETEGAQLALQSYVPGLYSWLSQWMNSDESKRPAWNGHGTLSNAPFRIVNDKTVLTLDDEDDEQGDGPAAGGTSASLMAAMTLNPTSPKEKPQSEKEVLLSELQVALCPTDVQSNNQPKKPNGVTHNRSREFMLAMSYGKSKPEKANESKKKPLPIPLQSLNKDELCCIWAIGDILSKPPSFKDLDPLSQLCLFSVSLMRRLLKSETDSMEDIAPVMSMPSYEGGRPTLLTNQKSRNEFGQEKVRFDTVASSAVLSALMSDSQAKLLDRCRSTKGEKFNWETTRALGIPYWVRSDKILGSIAEEIAQNVYKSTKNAMDCALYYIAMRNMKKLRAIAATDRSEHGKRFLNFISDHDFSSERGRNAAEKNAYSLLRKRKYMHAASFFLLAEPPMIKTALDVIKLQLQDWSLAFFVARLMENAPKSSNVPSDGGNLTIGGGFNLSSMGGGGGFATGIGNNIGGGGNLVEAYEEDTIKFDCWKPKLGKSARTVLLPKDPPADDVCFESLHLVWLGRPNEAKLRLSHLSANNRDAKDSEDLSFPPIFGTDESSETLENTVLKRANEIINFCAGPTLLKRMKPKKRVLWTSALLVSRALSRCGIEIPSMRILLQIADPAYEEDESTNLGVQAAKKTSSNDTTSSIFDSYGAAPPRAKPTAPKPSQTDPMSSSIFDSFDSAPPKPKPTAPKPSQPDPMASSIFDSFDAAPPKPKPAAPKPSQTDPMSSSIFDSFDAAPPKPKTAAPKPSQSDPMSSSIFDSFDTAPQKRNQKSSAVRPISKAGAADATDQVKKEQPFNIPSCPTLWNEWREQLIHVVAARRFFRELARIISSFDGEPNYIAMEEFAKRDHPLIPTGAAEVLHNACDSEGLLNSILKSLSELSTSFGVNETAILEQALELLPTKRQPKRIVFSVILQCLLGRGDLAEDQIRDAASFQMNSSELLGFSNDTIVDNRETRYYTSSLWARRESSSVIWQLELCLWLYRGGAFDMSATAFKETLLAVRVGLAAAAWGRCHLTLDTLIKAEPDCLMDFDAGKNLWRSMKIIVVNENTVDDIDGVTSGGWEFLVDCRREEATEMLRDGKTGQFLIRPHPQDPGVFTLSFKTNLVPTEPTPTTNYDEAGAIDKPQETAPTSGNKKVVKRDDVVQHAIVRLSDSGFRCGSFGPFATLVKLLHAVSDSLPFELRFSDPPIKGIISEKGIQTSPNSFLFRKLALHTKAQFFQFQSTEDIVTDVDDCIRPDGTLQNDYGNKDSADDGSLRSETNLHRRFGLFSQLLFLTELRKQLCAVAAAIEDDPDAGVIPHDERVNIFPEIAIDDDFDCSLSEGSLESDDEEALGVASRMVKPLLNWVRSREIDIVDELTPLITHDRQNPSHIEHSVNINASGNEVPSSTTHGDSMIRRMIQAGSGVDFRTLRVGEAGNSVIVVLFGKQDAIKWLMANETGNDEVEAKERLELMEMMRVIEPITSSDLSIPKSYAASHPSTESRYRFVDPWEVEALESRSGETASAALGRGRYQTLSVGHIANSCEKIVRASGGLHLLGLWSTLKGGIALTKALCSAHPPWERDAGGDLLMKKGFLMEPTPYDNSIRQHLYGNYLFRRLELPQRFLALVQVELLDLKNVTSPSGSSSLTAYALLRLKRQGSSAPLSHKARSLDSASTQARKISKISGPNAPASWGSLVRFRFPLPDNVNCEGKSFDTDRESLFKGPPTCLQITAYEKKFMSDVELGGADVNIESLGSGGQIEEWVPLRAGKDGITWFARIRLSLRFELLCLDSYLDTSESVKEERCPSVGLKKIQKLSRLGAHEDLKQGVKNSISTPDLMGFFWQS